MLPIAIQVYSVRDDAAKDLYSVLKKIKALGYEGVEFAGLYGYEPENIKKMLCELGLTAVSAHVPIDELLSDPAKVIGDYKTIGCKWIAIPWLSEERRPGNPGYAQTLKDIAMIADEAKRQGLTLLYHNHDFEFVKVDGEYALDVMYRNIPALATELDTCWVNVGGEDPVAYIDKYAGRAPVVHIKDFFMEGEKPETMYELIGQESKPKADRRATFEFRPVGYGLQDVAAIVAASQRVGAKWIVVEQDMPSMGKTAMECAEMSIRYLKNL